MQSTVLLISFTIINASLDLSNLDLSNMKFFKYPQKTHTGEILYRRHQPFNIFDPIDHFHRAKAMLKYFADVLFGKSKYKREIAVFFHPDTASRLRPHFQQKYGYRGERLIAALGSGYDESDLIHYDALSSNDQ